MDDPDLGTVEALCALQLAARRLGCTVRVCDANERLRELIALAGLDDVLIDPPAGEGRRDDAPRCRPGNGDTPPGPHDREEP